MFNIGDRVYVREDIQENIQDLPDFLGAQAVVINKREVNWSLRDMIMLEVLVDGDLHTKEWFAFRFGHCINRTPDWEV